MMGCAHPHTPLHDDRPRHRTRHPQPCTPRPHLPCLPPLSACHRCSSCSPFGCGQHALSWGTVAQRGELGLLHSNHAHNRTTTQERPHLPCPSPHVCGTRPGSGFDRGPGCLALRSRAQYGGPGVLAFFTRPTSLQAYILGNKDGHFSRNRCSPAHLYTARSTCTIPISPSYQSQQCPPTWVVVYIIIQVVYDATCPGLH